MRSDRPGSAAPLRGPEAWRWYARVFRDPVGGLLAAARRADPVLALAYPIPVRGRSIYHVLVTGTGLYRQVLGDSDLFRTTGQAISGARGSSQRRLRDGLTRSQRKKHQWQRRLLGPAFQRSAIDRRVPSIVAAADRALADWAPGQTRELWGDMRDLTLRMASDALFARQDPERSLALGRMIGAWLEHGFTAGVWLLPFDVRGTPYAGLMRQAEAIEREVRRLIDEKRAGAGESDDPLSLLVRANRAGERWMRDDDLVGQTTVLFGASYETTATAMTWLLFLLAQHPQVTHALLAEIAAEVGEGAPDAAALARMSWLDCVVRESMRVLTSVPYTIRVATGETRLGDVEIRRGDRVLVAYVAAHHDAALYPEPRRFRPERWREIRRGPYEYMAFGAGPRLCLGMSFAATAIKLAAVRILQRFRFTVPAGTRVDRTVRVAMAPRGPLPLALHPPDGRFETTRVAGDLLELVELPPPGAAARAAAGPKARAGAAAI